MKAFLRRNARLMALLILFALACLLAHRFLAHTVRIEGTSMSDTLRSGEIALVTRFDYHGARVPERGEIVECSFPGRDGVYIKRVIGLPGDRVEIRDSRTWINGEALSEPYASGPAEDYSAALGADEYLVMGDNRAESYDGRAEDMGFIHRENFLGRVRLVLWPLRSVH